MRNPYQDMLDMPRPVSKAHSPMPVSERAAQFAPFAALTGFDDIIEEAARLTTQRVELDEDAKRELDEKLNRLAARLDRDGQGVPVELTWFEPDPLKLGGSYRTQPVCVRQLDRTFRLLELEDRSVITFQQLLELRELP